MWKRFKLFFNIETREDRRLREENEILAMTPIERANARERLPVRLNSKVFTGRGAVLPCAQGDVDPYGLWTPEVQRSIEERLRDLTAEHRDKGDVQVS